MKFSEETRDSKFSVRAYAEGRIDVTTPEAPDEVIVVDTSVILTPNRLIRDWPPATLEAIQRDHFQQVAELRPELVLFGSGRHIAFPSPAVLEPLIAYGIGWEVMDTGAACRTFNVLVAEGRLVAAALLMIR